MSPHTIAWWCKDCTRGRWWHTRSYLEIPVATRERTFTFLDAVAGTRASQCCWAFLTAPLPETELWPVPQFMAVNGLVPWGRRGSLTVSLMSRGLRRFALRSAGLRSM